jgi:DNA-binding transcriptional LysR family regulator
MGTLPPLRKLQYVLAVAHALHFRKAAESLHVSQPAMSRQIKEYEIELGFEILHRDHHFVSLTKAGQYFVAGVEEILGRLENDFTETVRRSRAISRENPSEYVIAHSPFASMRIRRIVIDLQRKWSGDLLIRFRILPTAELLNAIECEVVHAGITYAPVDHAGITSIPIGCDHWVAVVPASGRFSKEPTAHIEDFSGELIISNGSDRTHPALFRQLEMECAAKGFPLKTIAEVTSPHEAFDLVEGNAGIVLLPAGVCAGLPPGLRAIRIVDISPLQMVLIYRSDKPEFARQFAEQIRAAVKAETENHSGFPDDISVHSVLRKPLTSARKTRPEQQRKRSVG